MSGPTAGALTALGCGGGSCGVGGAGQRAARLFEARAVGWVLQEVTADAAGDRICKPGLLRGAAQATLLGLGDRGVIREGAAESDNPVLLYCIGKKSSAT